LAESERLSLAIVEVVLPEMSGYELCRELKDKYGHDFRVVFISRARGEAIDRVAGLLIGADDYVVKPFDPDEFVVRVRRLIDGGTSPGGAAPPRNGVGLTRREAQVLGLLADGLTQTQIAAQLTISTKTVGTHIQRILAKLGVHSRAQAVALAVRGGALRDAS
jgi:DNA-binding NarL/FixJ family response regulator